MEAVQYFPKAFAIFFENLRRWDPASFHEIKWHWPKEVMAPISKVLKLRKEKVNRTRFNFSDLQPITIHFDGSLDRRKIDPTREYKMDLYFARQGDIVVAKIDLKNGAVALVPDDWNNVVVTSHFAVYEPDKRKLIPKYFHRIIQTDFFKAHLWRNKVGAEGRKEVKLNYFEALEVPLPPLPIQETIVEKWETAISEITAIEKRIKTLNANIDKEFLFSIGLYPNINQLQKKAFAVWWKQLSRWDVACAQNLGKDFRSSLYHNVTIFDVIQPLRATTTRSNPKLHPKEKVNYIGLANVEAATGRLVEFSPVFGEKIESSCVVFDQEHILYAKLRPYLRKVICPIEYGLSNGVASSEFLTIKPRENILKDFLAHYLRSTAVEIQARQAIGARMPRISSESLVNFIIPLPPLNIQQNILYKVKETQVQVMQQIEIVERKSQEIKAEIEALILGTKQIEGI